MAEDDLEIVRTLSAAFDDDPILNWLVRQDSHRSAAIRLFFSRVLRRYRPKGATYTTADRLAAALWAPPDEWDMSLGQLVLLLPVIVKMVSLGGLPRAIATIDAVKRAHPQEPHYYLYFVGVHPEAQGNGLGGAVLAPILAECDERRLGAYLENSKERNLAFYRRAGFEVSQELRPGPNAPNLWLMWRDPR